MRQKQTSALPEADTRGGHGAGAADMGKLDRLPCACKTFLN